MSGSDRLILMAMVAVTYGVLILMSLGLARDTAPQRLWASARTIHVYWWRFWLIAGGVLVAVEGMTAVGWGIVPVIAAVIITGIVVIGGFIGMLVCR